MSHLPYFDYMATTPIDPIALDKMLEALQDPRLQSATTSDHTYGQLTAQTEAACRSLIAECLDADPAGIIFTSCATESIHTVLRGAYQSYAHAANTHISWAHEHSATHGGLGQVSKMGGKINVLPVRNDGHIDLKDLESHLSDQVMMVTVSYVNSELGTIAPVKELTELCQARGILVHIDATQAVGKIPVSFHDIGCDYMSFSGHKIYGPRGIGAIIRKTNRHLTPLLPMPHGPSMRAGTQSIALIIAFAEACRIATESFSERLAHVKLCQNTLMTLLPSSTIHHGDLVNRVPHNLNFDSQLSWGELEKLKERFIFSQASACTDISTMSSHVLKAIGLDTTVAQRSIRLSLSHLTTLSDCHDFAAALSDLKVC